MGPAAGFDEHGDLTGPRQSRGSARTELTHRVEIAHRPQVERRRLHARALEGCTHSRLEVLRQRLHGSYRSRRGLRRCAPRRRRPSEHDPILSRGVRPDDSKAGRGVAGRGYSAAHHVDVSRGGHLRAPGRKPTPRRSRECRSLHEWRMPRSRCRTAIAAAGDPMRDSVPDATASVTSVAL